MTEFNLFGDPDYQQRFGIETKNRKLLAEGDGKHFIVAWIGDQDMETQFVCEWDEEDESAPCHLEGGGCLIKNSYDSIGDDMMEAVEEPQLLKVRLPIGYRTEGHGEDFEDYIYSVRPKVTRAAEKVCEFEIQNGISVCRNPKCPEHGDSNE